MWTGNVPFARSAGITPVPRNTTSLDGILGEALRRLGLEQGIRARQSLTLWERVAGETIANATRAGDIRNGTLYVYTRSSAWSQELSMLRETLMERLNAELGEEVVKDLRFQVKRFKAEETVGTPPEPTRELTDQERAVLRAIRDSAGEDIGPRVAAFAGRQMAHQAGQRTCAKCGGPVRGDETVCPFCKQ